MFLAAAGVAVAGVVEIYRKKALNAEGGAHTQVKKIPLFYIFVPLIVLPLCEKQKKIEETTF